MVDIVAISDTHRNHNNITHLLQDGGDIIIHSGDCTNLGTKAEFIDFILWFSALPFPHKLFIPGNHDLLIEDDPATCKLVCANLGVNLLIGEAVTIHDIKFYGFPWVPYFYDWAFMPSEQKLKELVEDIPLDVNYLISHGPPLDILDRTYINQNVGCKFLKKHLFKIQELQVVQCGHIHEDFGATHLNKRNYIQHPKNPMIMNVSNLGCRNPVFLKLDKQGYQITKGFEIKDYK